ncbi:13766_t:CDS:2 [Funneliformis mosseae]|uniref:13766_t:CDS:1 n=1 Tax=Funneliformis mosseae TaxID=27381 RepID=A0A9N8YMW7_FUNMO|nr:13766_t:CDS:2 [Funneliformis mosseae]
MGRNEIVRYDELISRSIGLNRRNERLNERLNEQSVEWTGRLIVLNRRLNERRFEWTDRSVGQNTNEWLNEPTLRDENDKKLNPKEELESFFTNWTNRVEVIEKYKELGVVKKFEIIDFYDFEP